MDRTITDPMIGRVLDGRYRVESRVARGGMATVYEAIDLRLDRVCAVKVMHQGLGDDADFTTRFVDEARSAASLSHPNVVGVFDQGDDDGTLFLAMEYVPGHTLRDLIRSQGPLPPTKALALLEPVLAALAAAHRAGMIHRDVKPENVLLADDGRVKVADFGLARAVSADTRHTATSGVLIGTVSYLSPELVLDGRADARSDVYSAGVLLYEMLTARKPHEGGSPIQVAYKHVHEDVPAPSLVVPGIPSYVDALVDRATARDGNLRPADAGVLLHHVRRVHAALDQGVEEDRELTEDLTPRRRAGFAAELDYLSEHTPRIVEPGEAAEITTVIGERYDARPDDARAVARPTRRGPLLLALVLVLAVAAGLAGWWFGMGRYAVTPGVVNLSQAEARERVEADGLEFQVAGRRFSEAVAAGSVITTDPAPGTDIARAGTVFATISRGPERYDVPEVVDQARADALSAVEDARLEVGDTRRRFDSDVPAGVVLSASPRPGTEVKPGTAVDLVLSKGPPPAKVPDLVGTDAERAKARLEALDLEVEVEVEHDDNVPEGDVIDQSAGGAREERVFPGDDIILTVSKGPVLVQVPSVAGAGVAEATQVMQEAGFEVRTEHSTLYVGLEYVVETDPAEGSEAPEGSIITLYLV